ncbi:hypothetical protein BpHYR1_041277 [Brachionus plicatilis]|uniref:Uncharacterized protein n=1 Tax=Brachionus plicatilis TaxID=10195 RepID=A0A3M7P4C1_BRAPC|nr:hypothetical protein BpHYR1_041277 [Brachionus plicatilis]
MFPINSKLKCAIKLRSEFNFNMVNVSYLNLFFSNQSGLTSSQIFEAIGKHSSLRNCIFHNFTKY